MRRPAVACLAGTLALLAGLAGACDEHFPTPAPPDAASAAPLAPAPPGIVPPAQRTNASSSRLAFDPLRGGLWTANGDIGTVSYVDVDRRVAVNEIAVGSDVTSVALSPDAAWVAAVDRGGATVTLIDAETSSREGGTPAARSKIRVGGHPRACVWDAANPRWLYVAVEDDGTVAVVDRFLGEVATVVPVGRLPSGLAVSASQRELYVAHRIDPTLTIIDLRDRAAVADVPLADEPFSDAKTPNGKPFAFEAPAIASGGATAWLPHELLAPTHPFVFDETLFPAISVVDLARRIEVQSDPNLPGIAGRKNLFHAINLLGPDGQPEVFSQPCAVAMHPSGFVAWALACASEDVLVFDIGAGIATDALRNLPVDHPVALTLDDTGQRLFVLGDQSHDVATFDTGNGSLVAHTEMYGAPIAVHPGTPQDAGVLADAGSDASAPVVDDPVAAANPALREGLRLFFRSNSAKGVLATSANDWMSCGGCHLDGFTSTNARLFEALSPADPARDALIGHVGLVDHFASIVDAIEPATFNPHDVLVALLEQGGLAQDRTGRNPAGAVDPSNPSPDAITMARQLAAVVARDLPDQPSWEQVQGVPNPAWDAEYCGKCHQPEYEAWRASVHNRATGDPMVTFCLDQEPQFLPQCAGCHDPMVARLSPDAGQPLYHGVTCLGCHDVEREMRAGGNGDLVTVAHADWGSDPMGNVDHKARALASLETLRQPEFCGGCHQQFVPGNGFGAISTYSEYHDSVYPAAGTRCIDCHMQKDPNGVANHRFPGGNVYLGGIIDDATLLAQQRRNLATTVDLVATRTPAGVEVVVTNRGAGHAFPTGVTDIREPWIEVDEVDPSAPDASVPDGARYGGPGSDGLIPSSAARMGSDFAGVDGGLLLDHQLGLVARVPFDVRVPAGEAQSFFVPVPSSAETSRLRAALYYRNVRTTYYRDATKDPAGHAPDVAMIQVQVQEP